MQTTTRKSWNDSGQFKIVLLFLGVAVLLVIGAVFLATQRANDAAVDEGASEVTIQQPSSPAEVQADSDETSIMSIKESRFHDWNSVLPNFGAQPALMSIKEFRFHDWNTVHPNSGAQSALPTGERGQRH